MTREELESRLTTAWVPYDARAAERAVEALGEFLVAVWLRLREQGGDPPGACVAA